MARIVLVHGAFSGAWWWEPVLPALRATDHTVETFDLPGAGDDPTPVADVSLPGYAERICGELAAGPPAVLVGHSMGGMAVTQAAARCPEQVAALVYIGAFAPAPGQSLGELITWPEAAGDSVQANLVVEGDPPVGILPAEAAPDALFNCCDAEQAAWASAKLGPQPVRPFGDPVQLDEAAREAFERIPRAYIVCTQDRAISPAMQRRMLAQIGCDPVLELDADHWPWVSAEDGFVAAIDRLASSH